MRVIVNDKPFESESICSLADLLSQLGYKDKPVAVAMNGMVVPRNELASVAPAEGEQIEILVPMQGG